MLDSCPGTVAWSPVSDPKDDLTGGDTRVVDRWPQDDNEAGCIMLVAAPGTDAQGISPGGAITRDSGEGWHKHTWHCNTEGRLTYFCFSREREVSDTGRSQTSCGRHCQPTNKRLTRSHSGRRRRGRSSSTSSSAYSSLSRRRPWLITTD